MLRMRPQRSLPLSRTHPQHQRVRLLHPDPRVCEVADVHPSRHPLRCLGKDRQRLRRSPNLYSQGRHRLPIHGHGPRHPGSSQDHPEQPQPGESRLAASSPAARTPPLSHNSGRLPVQSPARAPSVAEGSHSAHRRNYLCSHGMQFHPVTLSFHRMLPIEQAASPAFRSLVRGQDVAAGALSRLALVH
jgi:hypothetical protein